jgi:uncharacterized protein YggU (UPF0235/DUF167 family)
VRITVRVKPGSKKGPLVVEEGGEFTVFIKERAVDGAANEGLIATLATHFGLSKSKVTIESGFTSRIKRVQIEGM